jgi:hypothetical protein
VKNARVYHAGEFERLPELLTGDEDRWLAEGRGEVDEMVAGMAAAEREVTYVQS